MKQLYVTISFLVILSGACAQQWDWAMHEPGYWGRCMDEDSIGNIYTAFGTGANPDVSQFSKIDSLGNNLWSKTINCVINDLKVGNNHIAIAGSFTGSVTFNTVTLNSVGGNDAFVAYYDFAGNLIWVKQASGIENSIVTSIAINMNDEVFFCMSNDSITSFAGTTFSKGIAIGVLNNSGMLTNNFQINGKVFSANLSIDVYDNIYLIGGYNDSSLVIGSTTVICSDTYYGAYFFAKMHRNGTEFWVKDFGTKFKRTVANIRATANGNIYFTETPFYTQAYFNKLASNGNAIWSKPIASGLYSEVRDMKLDANENIYLTGMLWNSGTFGSCTANGSQYFLFVAKLDSAGGCYWTQTGQSTDQSSGYGLSIKRTSHVMMLGWAINDLVVQLPPISVQGTNFLARISLSGTLNVEKFSIRKEGIKMYPNPCSGIFTIDIANVHDEIKIRVYDLLGKCVLDKSPIKNDIREIDLREQAKGIYFVEIESQGKKNVKKVVVQ